MAEARPILPTDLLALVSYNGRHYPNQAWTRERLGSAEPSSLKLGVALDQFLVFARGRSAWISVRRQRLRGLVGARTRGDRQAWEIDYLIDATTEIEALPGLLECAVMDVGRSGGEKLFVRLPGGCDLLRTVVDTGFIAHREESLYARVGLPAAGETVALRPMTPGDSYPAYRLYNATTPGVTRRNEAATFSEWHASQERRWLRGGVQLVGERNGQIEAHVRAARLAQGVAVEVLADGEARKDLAALIAAGVEAVGGRGLPVFMLTPSAYGFGAHLEELGFSLQDEYVSLLRRTTRPVVMPKLSPAIAKTAIGV